jgi:hypothetical protein
VRPDVSTGWMRTLQFKLLISKSRAREAEFSENDVSQLGSEYALFQHAIDFESRTNCGSVVTGEHRDPSGSDVILRPKSRLKRFRTLGACTQSWSLVWIAKVSMSTCQGWHRGI